MLIFSYNISIIANELWVQFVASPNEIIIISHPFAFSEVFLPKRHIFGRFVFLSMLDNFEDFNYCRLNIIPPAIIIISNDNGVARLPILNIHHGGRFSFSCLPPFTSSWWYNKVTRLPETTGSGDEQSTPLYQVSRCWLDGLAHLHSNHRPLHYARCDDSTWEWMMNISSSAFPSSMRLCARVRVAAMNFSIRICWNSWSSRRWGWTCVCWWQTNDFSSSTSNIFY